MILITMNIAKKYKKVQKSIKNANKLFAIFEKVYNKLEEEVNEIQQMIEDRKSNHELEIQIKESVYKSDMLDLDSFKKELEYHKDRVEKIIK